ncbi:MAG: hypothetical protein ACI4HI_00225 [Lachnospiraceae bacterium]
MSFQKPGNTIGLILPDAKSHYCVTLIESLSKKFAELGYTLFVALSGHDVNIERNLLSYYEKTADGILIISDAAEYGVLSDVVPDSVPTIFLNRKPSGCQNTSIIENDYSAVYQEIFSLKAEGHSKIGCICTWPYFSTSREIVRSYCDALGFEYDTDPEAMIYYTNGDNSRIPSIAEDLHQKGCTAVFTGSQSLTKNFMDFLLMFNRSTDRPMMLAGFATKDYNAPMIQSLDVVAQPLEQTIDLAVQQLIYRIRHPGTPERDFILKGSLQKHTIDPFA